MAKVTLDVTFDGTTTVDRLDGQSSIPWFGTPPDTTSMDIYSVYLEGDDTLEATAGLTGSDWRIKYFRIAGDNHVTTISDLDAGEDRRIETLLLGYNSELSLISTRVDFIYGWEGDKHVIKLGDQQESSIKAIILAADLNIIQTGVAHVSNIRTDNGDNVSRITVNSGGVGSIKTGDGADRLIVQDGGSVDAVNLKGGDDTVIVRGDARVEFLRAYDGDKTISIIGEESRLRNIKLGDGSHEVTSDSYISHINAYESDLTLTLNGGAGVISIDRETGQTHSHNVVINGSISSFVATDRGSDATDDQSTRITLNGYSGSVMLGNGKDLVKTGTEYVEHISTSGGNDKVVMGTGGIGFIRTGAGNDTVQLNRSDPDYGVVLQGESGTDTLDFLKLKSGVVFSLGEAGAYQKPEGDMSGYYSAVGFENLKGSNAADILVGSGSSNQLIGRKGNDTLVGGEGDDTLAGNAGRDVFVFGANGGTDTVRDYQDGIDLLLIEDNAGGFKTLDISKEGKHWVIDYDGGTIILQGAAGDTTLTRADFDFV